MAGQAQTEGWRLVPKYLAGVIIGALVFVVVPESVRWLNGAAFAQGQSPYLGGPIINNAPSINTFNQSGGNNTINVGPTSRRLSDARANTLKSQMLNEFPRGAKIAVVSLAGDPEAFQFAQDIVDFLKDHNFQVDGVAQGFFNRPIKGIAKKNNPDGSIEIQVGSNQP